MNPTTLCICVKNKKRVPAISMSLYRSTELPDFRVVCWKCHCDSLFGSQMCIPAKSRMEDDGLLW